jgi:hypothetical protein
MFNSSYSELLDLNNDNAFIDPLTNDIDFWKNFTYLEQPQHSFQPATSQKPTKDQPATHDQKRKRNTEASQRFRAKKKAMVEGIKQN